MAPRGGRGGFHGSGGGSGSGVQCNGPAFEDATVIVFFVNTVLFFVLFTLLGFIAPGFSKKCGTGKKLIGAPYLIAIFFTALGFLLSLIATVLSQCNEGGYNTYYSLLIPSYIFLNLGYWLLIFVYVYVLNIMLRERLGGSALIYKVICLAMVGILFALFCGLIGIQSYDLWSQTGDGFGMQPLIYSEIKLTVALDVLVFVATLAAAGLAIMSLVSLRSKQHPANGTLPFVIALYFCAVLVAIFSIVFAASSLQASMNYNTPGLSIITQEALSYLQNFFTFFAFVILLFIAKHIGWDSSAAAPTTPYAPVAQNQQQTHYVQPPMHQQQQQYAYNQANVPQQQYYQQQGPVYHNTHP